MKAFRNILRAIVIIASIAALNSCSDDGPDYGKMRVSRMDIAGAKAVGFIDSSTGSRADAVSSGLYKIDANGNISAVAVYFTEDEEGNQTKHESEVRMEQAGMANVGNNYIYFSNCSFTDKNGEYIYGLPRKILVRKTDGKMWNLDEEYTGIDIPNVYVLKDWQFYQAADGTLYYSDSKINDYSYSELIYRFNLKSEPATIQQVTATRTFAPYAVDSNGIICGGVNGGRDSSFSSTLPPEFLWQNSGFQLFPHVNPFETDYSTISSSSVIGGVVLFGDQYYQVLFKHDWRVPDSFNVSVSGTCNKISIGSTPGSAVLDKSETLILKDYGSYITIISSMITPKYILFSTDYGIIALNPEIKEWKVVKTPKPLDLYKSITYDNRYWIIDSSIDNLGAFWFNSDSFETGFVKFNVTLPSFAHRYDVVDGKVIFSGINPADSHTVTIIVDLTTGSVLTEEDETPEMLFSTLISLN
ncbi:MAG: hypothetical protein K2I89_07355 [Muribaculaceae bacterium]|nr:hypothetical protein [Muribaculaceae bacterium]MDE5595370.1 hypothetical protein [Muribaculaceae bacterium]